MCLWPDLSSAPSGPSEPKLHRVVLIRTDTPPIVPLVPLHYRLRWAGDNTEQKKNLFVSAMKMSFHCHKSPRSMHHMLSCNWSPTFSLSLLNHLYPQWPVRCDTQRLKYFKDKMTRGWIKIPQVCFLPAVDAFRQTPLGWQELMANPKTHRENNESDSNSITLSA